MAKLTARFDLEDKVSKKLKRIHKGFKEVEKKAKTINRQIKISIRAEDQAFYRLRKINDYIILKFAKSLQIKVAIDDQATVKLEALEKKMKLLPKKMNISISLSEHVTPAYKKMKKMLTNHVFSFLLVADDQITLTVKKIIGFIKRNLERGYTVKLKVIDEITKTVNRLTLLLRKFAKTYYIKLEAKDKVSEKVNKQKSPIEYKKDESKKGTDKKSDKDSEKESDQKPGWVGKIKGWLKDWWTKSAWPWIKDTLNEIGKAFMDRFKERLMEKLKDDVFDKIIDKILGPQKKKDSEGKEETENKVKNRNTGGCCCCRSGERNGPGRKRNKNPRKKRKGPATKKSPARTIKVPSEVVKNRQEKSSGKKTVGSKMKKWLGDLTSAGEESSKLGKALKGFGKLGKAIPYIGNALSLLDLQGTNKDNVGEKVGTVGGRIAGMEAGGIAGAEAGAAIGSFAGPAGTVIGGAAGGLAGGALGAFGGEEAGKSIGKLFDVSKLKEDISKTLFNGNWWNEKWEGVKTSAGNTLGGLDEAWGNIKNTASTSFFNNSEWWAEKAGYAYGAMEATLFNGDWWKGKWEGVKGWTSQKWEEASSIWNDVKSNVKETVFNQEWWNGKWKDVQGWAKDKWEHSQEVWGTFKSKIKDTLFNQEWWSEKWNSVKRWGESILGDTWDAVKSAGGKVAGTAKSIGGKVVDASMNIGNGVKNWFSGVSASFQKGRNKAHQDFNYEPDKNATGGYITKPTISWIGEAGKEFVIPVDNNRGRGKMLLSQAASKLGMRVVDNIGAAASPAGTPALGGVSSSSVSASVSPSVDASGLNGQASTLGKQFTEGFDSGISSNAVDMEAWKQKNISTPFNNLISASPNYGKQVVTSYAKGQNATQTGTDAFLQSKVKTPYQSAVNQSSSWGIGTVKGFSAGQNAKDTGTAQYVSTHVDKPFLQSKDASNGWGSGLVGNFVSGMISKGSEVKQAAKDMAKKVEEAFREELDIHSPSRVMMSLGRFASVGVVKGLGSVDVKKFAEKQAGSLAAAFSGMGAAGGNVKEWLLAAMSATNTPLSWLPGLMTIAQNESGGNPNAINLWDSNAKAGHPSQGLMQTIPSTFDDHKAPGMNDIRNPIHNAAAAIGYIKSRYGSINNVPGIKSMNHGGPYIGYANGGLITKEQIARVGEGNKREWIIPEERGIRGRYLLQQAAQALGMEVSDPSQADPASLSAGTVSAAVTGSRETVQKAGTNEIKIEFSGEQHFHNGQDADSLAAKIKQALIDELQKDIYTGAKGAVAFD
ncbi:transglycosylase SLT domain-containing protein [Bacillus sp. YC2]|uniref:transglycosylase SLT domain-containing protein n=1 Tax=Bacillus sp. YC2 TaxID=2861287 RepID=UPI001CA5FEF0|nr:transglycosylase SLT domain-containing protein [Bacillus sp. YC2]MBY8913816.1 transglycosylase SLT domain-containing protein [Bacillus sp. YC2]